MAPSSSYSRYCVPLNDNPLHTNRKLRVTCIGAGFAGITLAYKVAHELKIEDLIELKIYERQVSRSILDISLSSLAD